MRTPDTDTDTHAGTAAAAAVNLVTLTGRVSAEAEHRQLPSGDPVVSFRLVVPRSARARKRSKITVDTFDCSAWTARLRRTASTLTAGAEIRVVGELRRQFARTGGVPTSRVTIDVLEIHRS